MKKYIAMLDEEDNYWFNQECKRCKRGGRACKNHKFGFNLALDEESCSCTEMNCRTKAGHRKKKYRKKKNPRTKKRPCYNCGEPGHYTKHCPKEQIECSCSVPCRTVKLHQDKMRWR